MFTDASGRGTSENMKSNTLGLVLDLNSYELLQEANRALSPKNPTANYQQPLSPSSTTSSSSSTQQQLSIELDNCKREKQTIVNQYNELVYMYNTLLDDKNTLEKVFATKCEQVEEYRKQYNALLQRMQGERKLITQEDKMQKKAKDYDHLTKKFDFR
jgi:uncharacterized membrane-anchored protein YhcB (DUF1043 family)